MPGEWMTAIGVLAFLAAAFLYAWRRAAARATGFKEELAKLKAAPRTNEFRVDRFDLAWFPTVTFLEGEKLLTQVSPGVPYCRSCSKALAPQPSGGWKCAGCGNQRSDSVADTTATDSVMKEAVAFFLQRHPEYRLAAEVQRFK